MNEDTLKYKIALTLIKGIGCNLAKNLLAYVGSAEGVFHEKEKNLAKIPGIGTILSKEIVSQEVLPRAEAEIAFIEKNHIQPLFFTDKEYPFRLKECNDAPIMIYCKGECNLNDGKFLGVVGTRKATEEGKRNCRQLIEELSSTLPDLIVVSGLAYGIDICAHKTALANKTSTIAVLGHGLDRIYPASHRSIAVKILKNGCLLTEYLTNTNPDRQNFVRRNRIIAGLCDAVVVVESAIKGGALITAELANDYDRDVFTFPGRVTDERSAGCNALIKTNKASLIESAEDVLQFMNWDRQNVNNQGDIQKTMYFDLSPEEEEILSLLRHSHDGIQVNELAVSLSQPFNKISSLLLEMEFKGLVACLPGNLYKAI